MHKPIKLDHHSHAHPSQQPKTTHACPALVSQVLHAPAIHLPAPPHKITVTCIAHSATVLWAIFDHAVADIDLHNEEVDHRQRFQHNRISCQIVVEDRIECSVDGLVEQLVIDRVIIATELSETRPYAPLVEVCAVVCGEVGANGRQIGIVYGQHKTTCKLFVGCIEGVDC